MAKTESINTIERAEQADAARRHEAKGPDGRRYNRPYNYTLAALQWGGIGGVLLALLTIFGFGLAQGINFGLVFAGSVVLAPVIYLALQAMRKRLAAGEVMKTGAGHGIAVSAVGALIGSIVSAVVMMNSSVISEAGPSSGMDTAVTTFFNFLMWTVGGATITFILLQGLKSDAPADEFVEEQQHA